MVAYPVYKHASFEQYSQLIDSETAWHSWSASIIPEVSDWSKGIVQVHVCCDSTTLFTRTEVEFLVWSITNI